ncbi:MAG: hypothetical protein P8X74_08510 [Reinekea sp.]
MKSTNKGHQIRFYDYGSPYYKVYDPKLGKSVYFPVKRHGSKSAAKAAAKQYFQDSEESKLSALLRAAQVKTGLPRGLSLVSTVYTRKRPNQYVDCHIAQIRVDIRMRDLKVIQRSVAQIPFSEAFKDLALIYAKRAKLSESDTERLLLLEETARKVLLNRYRKACRNYGTKPIGSILQNIKA